MRSPEKSLRAELRIREILKLGEDLDSKRTIAELEHIQHENRLSKRQSTERTRARLSRMARAADIIAEALTEMDEHGLDEGLLRAPDVQFDVAHQLARATGARPPTKERLADAPFTVAAARSRAQALAERTKLAHESVPKPGHRQSGNNRVIIKLLSLIYFYRRKRLPSPKTGDFIELVGYVLDLKDPGKEIRAGLRGKG